MVQGLHCVSDMIKLTLSNSKVFVASWALSSWSNVCFQRSKNMWWRSWFIIIHQHGNHSTAMWSDIQVKTIWDTAYITLYHPSAAVLSLHSLSSEPSMRRAVHLFTPFPWEWHLPLSLNLVLTLSGHYSEAAWNEIIFQTVKSRALDESQSRE
jgi:hypothetical protein